MPRAYHFSSSSLLLLLLLLAIASELRERDAPLGKHSPVRSFSCPYTFLPNYLEFECVPTKPLTNPITHTPSLFAQSLPFTARRQSSELGESHTPPTWLLPVLASRAFLSKENSFPLSAPGWPRAAEPGGRKELVPTPRCSIDTAFVTSTDVSALIIFDQRPVYRNERHRQEENALAGIGPQPAGPDLGRQAVIENRRNKAKRTQL